MHAQPSSSAQIRARALRLPAQRRGDFGLSRNRWRGSRPRPAPRSLRSDSVSCVSQQLGSVRRGLGGKGVPTTICGATLTLSLPGSHGEPVRTCSTRGLERPLFRHFHTPPTPPLPNKKSKQVVGILLQGWLNQNLIRATADAL